MRSVGDVAASAVCAQLAESAWPRSQSERRQLIDRLTAERVRCKNDVAFLALLGGLWLEDGDVEQALLWLERALLLDPSHMGAQVDHALALAAQGDLSARDELLKAFDGRPDVPPLALARLKATGAGGSGGPGRNGNGNGRWIHAREISLLLGHESNLNHSPRLNELTLTFPEESVVLPISQQPRSGHAELLDVSWQSGYSINPGLMIQGGVQGVGRNAPGAKDTNWHSTQAGLALISRLGQWRATAQWTSTWFGGELSQPYKAQRSSIFGESTAWACQNRFSVDFERRTQSGGDYQNTGQVLGFGWSALCPLGGSDWVAGLALRTANDRPLDSSRPGGRQRQSSIGLRAFGSLGAGVKLDLNLRYTRAKDDEGYFELLENNARRKLVPTSMSIELSKPIDSPLGPGGLDLIGQIQGVNQSSNIPLFRYSAYSFMVGTRARW